MSIRGIEMHYYAVCKRKLWLFNRGIGFEQQHDRVEEGKVLHEHAYGRLDKEINIDDMAVMDAVDGEYVREVKISSKMEHADRLQLLYYLYLLKERGVEKKGLLSYPKEKKTTEIVLGLDENMEVLKALDGVQKILEGNLPRYRKLKVCAKCAYRDFCESGEGGDDV
ncbi:CRISPR-associated protein Cas4 [Paenibacillus sp. IHBB 10380]|uniref:CRISPR-associated protein Cas4 n=1 Tax=Paenibacillus sp. IHBB 10380 TaxID=1566358 RepID=UPI0005CFAE70|nr:CRISPR-associated protein Cas4 [Paenibacillus sp. IHBB 10380]AJS57314.1 CRISPR-associated protein Cas4 [Paenibacillus sp. IHBB 10380]